MTLLRQRKDRAYAVDIEIEERIVFLAASPQAIAFDLHGDRLLYHRAEWRYSVIKGTEKIYDFGHVVAVICHLPGGEPLADVAHGQAFAVVASDAVAEHPGFSGPRVIEVIAADPTSGDFAVYSHREDVVDPYITDLKTFNASGQVLAFTIIPQPAGGVSLPWHVPHAILYDGWLWAIERDSTIWADPPITGRIVRRPTASVSLLSNFLELPPGEQYVFPHSLAYDPFRGQLWVLLSVWNNPDTLEAHETSGLTRLDAVTLALIDERPADFGFNLYEPPPNEKRPYAWPFQFAPGPNDGGFLIFDGDEDTISFVSVGHGDPLTYTPEAILPEEWTTFRWRPGARGEHLETLGPGLPVPLHRTTSGFIGAFQSTLPPEEL